MPVNLRTRTHVSTSGAKLERARRRAMLLRPTTTMQLPQMGRVSALGHLPIGIEIKVPVRLTMTHYPGWRPQTDREWIDQNQRERDSQRQERRTYNETHRRPIDTETGSHDQFLEEKARRDANRPYKK